MDFEEFLAWFAMEADDLDRKDNPKVKSLRNKLRTKKLMREVREATVDTLKKTFVPKEETVAKWKENAK